jgi:Cu-processing system permease protein
VQKVCRRAWRSTVEDRSSRLAVSLAVSLGLGFGVAAAIIAARGGTDAAAFLRLIGFAFVLALAMLSVGFLISALTRRASVALGAAIFIWLLLVFVGDLGLMSSTVAFRLQVTDLFHLSLINPLQVFKMASLGSINASLDVLGPAGLYPMQTYGKALGAIFAAVLAAWVVVPLAMATVLFIRRGAS